LLLFDIGFSIIIITNAARKEADFPDLLEAGTLDEMHVK